MKNFTSVFILPLLLTISMVNAQTPSAEFTYPRIDLTANFNITYPDATATYAWDFGDGNTGTGLNPVHTYDDEGIYVATLVASNAAGTQTDSVSRYLSVTDNDDCLYADSLELVAFYQAMGAGLNWINPWDLSTPVGSWYGVTVTGCRVSCLDLDGDVDCVNDWNSGNNLVGKLVDLNLPDLTKLFLNSNQLNGQILDFSSLPNMTHLYMHNTQLNSSIPDFSNLPNLTHFSLFNNEIIGQIPDFSNLPNLVDLDLSSNELRGEIPDFSNLPNLEYLDLLGNLLTGQIPDFSNLPNLTILNLVNNRLTDSIPNFFNTPNMSSLSLSHNQLTGSIPDFSNLSNISNLRLNDNQLNDTIPDFSNLPSLQWLDLRENQLSGLVPNFSNLPVLTSVWLAYNQLSGSIPNFANTPYLINLYIGNNQLSGHIPDFSNIPYLRTLYMNNNQFNDTIPNFSNLPELRDFYVDNNQLCGKIPEFSDVPKLANLSLYNNELGESIPDFGISNYLIRLYLHENNFNFEDFTLNMSSNLGILIDFHYAPQDSIETFININILSAHAGGNLPDNTYIWYKDGIQQTIIVGDSTYTPAQSGYYQCRVENAIVTRQESYQDLYLWSKMVYFDADAVPAFIASTSLVSDVTCNASNNGTALATPTGGQSPYTYLWDNNETTQTATALSAGNHTVTVTDDNGDIVTASVLIQEPAAIVIQATTVDATCSGASDGEIMANATGGTSPYSYQWNNGENSTTITGLSEGLYLVSVTDANGCLATNEVTVNAPSSTNSDETLDGGEPPFITTCPSDYLTFYVYNGNTGQANYSRYVFLLNGVVLQDGSSNMLTTNNLQDNDVISAITYDAVGCAYNVPNIKTINAHESPEITLCHPTPNTLEISLTQGTPPWSFDLVTYEGAIPIATTPYNNITTLSTSIALMRNQSYQLENVVLDNVPCAYTTTYPVGHIEGCEAICVGYSPSYTERYTATFPNTPSNIQWSILPNNAGIPIVSGQGTAMVELDFSNPLPSYEEITLQAEAMTDCGTEILAYNIKLDTMCVWPGDVNLDDSVKIDNGILWVDDAIALVFAEYDYTAIVNDQSSSGAVLYNPQREPGCLADSTHEWQPQSAINWEIVALDGTRNDAEFHILDGLGQITNTLNLKYADCDGDGDINTNQSWDETLNTPFSSVADPTDHDIITYHAVNGRAHNGNMPTAKLQSYAEHIRIEASNDTTMLGDDIVFRVYLGSDDEPIRGVRHVVFMAEAEFGVYKRPVLQVDVNSPTIWHPTNLNQVDYPFLHEDYDGKKNDSLRWYISLGFYDSTDSIDFLGEEVCYLSCHVTVAGVNGGYPNGGYPNGGNKLNSNDLIPVTIKIPAAGIILEGNRFIYAQSNIDTIWVRPNPQLHARVLLEGSYDPATGLMCDDLRDQGFLPATEPFTEIGGYNFPHAAMRGMQMSDSAAVCSITGDSAIVDWVMIEVRDKFDPTVVVAARPALLNRSGRVVDMDGRSAPRLWYVPDGEYYVVIRHRNHLAVMTTQPVLLDDTNVMVDFTQDACYGNGAKLSPDGRYVLYTGDLTGDGKIDAADRSTAWNDRNRTGYLISDCNLDGQVTASERSITWNNRNRQTQVP